MKLACSILIDEALLDFRSATFNCKCTIAVVFKLVYAYEGMCNIITKRSTDHVHISIPVLCLGRLR